MEESCEQIELLNLNRPRSFGKWSLSVEFFFFKLEEEGFRGKYVHDFDWIEWGKIRFRFEWMEPLRNGYIHRRPGRLQALFRQFFLLFFLFVSVISPQLSLLSLFSTCCLSRRNQSEPSDSSLITFPFSIQPHHLSFGRYMCRLISSSTPRLSPITLP